MVKDPDCVGLEHQTLQQAIITSSSLKLIKTQKKDVSRACDLVVTTKRLILNPYLYMLSDACALDSFLKT